MPRKAKAVSEQDTLIARTVGGRIKSLRENLGLTPKEFGDISGVSQAQQYRIESGERVPDLIYLARIKAARGIGIESLLPEVLPAPVSSQADPRPSVSVSGNRNVVAGRDVIQAGAAGRKKKPIK